MRAKSTKDKYGPPIDLRAMEEEVLAEGQEWMRRRMEDKLNEAAKSFPPGSPPSGPASKADGSDHERGRRRACRLRTGS